MLSIFYGDLKEAVYNTAAYFKYDYEDDWIVDPFVKKMIEDVDKSAVLDSGVIDSPVLGKIPPVGLSGGVKTLILVKFEKDKIFRQLLQCRYFGNMTDIAVQVFDGGVLRPLCMVNAVVVSLAANGAFDAAASITK